MTPPAIALAGRLFEPHLSGALWWPAQATLIVADLHFEKASALAGRRRGPLLPPYDTAATIARLAEIVARFAPRRVISLGDAFHDDGGPDRLDPADHAALTGLVRGRDWLWITGNHDCGARPPGGTVVTEAIVDGIAFRHAPDPVARPAAAEVVGHFHPKAAVRTRRGRVAGRCFVGDSHRLVLPAFGAYTGGLDVLDPAIRALFTARFAVGLIGRRGVHAFAGDALVPLAA